jgi:hypothetical protein
MPIGRAMLPQDPAPSYSMLILGWRSVLRGPENPHQPRHERAFPRPLADEVIAALMGAWP